MERQETNRLSAYQTERSVSCPRNFRPVGEKKVYEEHNDCDPTRVSPPTTN